MKKYKFFVLILLITLMTSIGVNATTVDGDYSYTTYDNEGYDLITGEALENNDMSRTNRVEIARDSIDDKIYFNDDDFSHVLFFNSSNIYIGYGNGNGSTRELSSYIGDVIPDGDDYYIEVPENARKFALMNYNFGAFRDDIIYTNEDIDNIAWGSLSYRDIFEGNNLILNSEFETTDNWSCFICSLSIVDNAGLVTPNGTSTELYFYQFSVTDLITDTNTYFVSVDTLYPTSFDNFIINLETWTLGYNDLTYTDDITEITTFSDNFTAQKDSDYIFFHFNKSTTITAAETIYVDNIYLYDLTDIFTINLPTAPEFETMKLYYDTYKDAVDEISYNDIFEGNNLISNGVFDTDTDWIYNPTNYTIGSGVMHSNDIALSYIQTNLSVIEDNLYYLHFEISNASTYANMIIANTGGAVLFDEYSSYVNYYNGFYSNIYTATLTRNDIRFYFTTVGSEFDFDNLMVFDLTNIFGYVEDDITTTWIEARYDEWLDPLADYYPNYYPASTLILNTVYYKYDDTPPAPADFQTSFDDKLVSIGVDTPQEELFGAFLIMIIVAVLLGLKFKSVAIVMIAELSLIFIFTVLGWFSLWFILVLALTFVLLILLKALKGGQK